MTKSNPVVKIWRTHIQTKTYTLLTETGDYPGVDIWLVHVNQHTGTVILDVEPLGRDTLASKTTQLDHVEGALGKWEKVYLSNQRTTKLLEPVLRSKGFLPEPHPRDLFSQTRNKTTHCIQLEPFPIPGDNEEFSEFIGQGEDIRLSMTISPEAAQKHLKPFTEDPRVRWYNPDTDKETLHHLYKWYDGTEINTTEWNKSWEAESTLVAQEHSRVVAFCLCFTGDRIGLYPRQGIIGDIYVEPLHRRKGLASALLAKATTKLGDCVEIRLGTNITKWPALNLFKNTGFEVDNITTGEKPAQTSWMKQPR